MNRESEELMAYKERQYARRWRQVRTVLMLGLLLALIVSLAIVNAHDPADPLRQIGSRTQSAGTKGPH